ncbi:MAG: four helix bundle protein [Deltaproteobacteria bacterium]
MQEPVTVKNLKVWQKAYALTFQVYKMTESYPKHEIYGLVSQIRRSALSVVSNFAEGYARRNKAEYQRFLSFSYGSLIEFETQLLLSKDLSYCSNVEFRKLDGLRNEIGSMLYAMIEKLKIPRS